MLRRTPGGAYCKEATSVHLYLIRHGIAVPYGTPGVASDADRDLTASGTKKIRRNARALARLGEVIAEIWTSPLERARRTAEIMADELRVTAPIRVVDALQPDKDFSSLRDELERQLEKTGIALVGHEPDLGELATYLLTGVRSPSFRFKKGGVACIEVYQVNPPPRCQLRWLLTPRQMAAIAGD